MYIGITWSQSVSMNNLAGEYSLITELLPTKVGGGVGGGGGIYMQYSL